LAYAGVPAGGQVGLQVKVDMKGGENFWAPMPKAPAWQTEEADSAPRPPMTPRPPSTPPPRLQAPLAVAAAHAAKAAGPMPPASQPAEAAFARRSQEELPPASVGVPLPLGKVEPGKAAKVDETKDYTGTIILYDAANGRGFIMCAEVKKITGSTVYVHKNVVAASNAKLGDTVRFKVHMNAKGAPQAQHPLRILGSGPPRRVVVSRFPEEFLALEAGEISELVKRELEPFGPLVAAPTLNEDGSEAIATFCDAAAAKSAVDGLANSTFKVALLFGFDERSSKLDGEGGADNFYNTVAQSKQNLGNGNRLNLNREYVGVIQQIDEGAGRGFIESEEVKRITNCLVYVHKNVLWSARGVKVGDTVTFKIHLNTKGLPQAQRPLRLAGSRRIGTFVEVSRFPEDWFGQTPDDLVRRATTELEKFGSLSVPPTVSYGCKEVVAAFSDPNAARIAVQCSEAADYQVALYRAPEREGRRRGHTSQEEDQEDEDGANSILVQGFPRRWSEAELTAFLRGAAPTVKRQVTVVHVLTQQGSTCGFARVRFPEATMARRAGKELAGQKVAGWPISVTVEDTEGPNCGGMEGTVILHVDELDMPLRPEMQPAPTDREVWVDPLPDEETIKGWLAAFGDAEEVFRPPDPHTGQPAERGYVLFEKHESARDCIEAGAGAWSESERILSSRKCDPRASAYAHSVVARLVGAARARGEPGQGIQAIQEATGVNKLQLRGTDTRPVTSKRIHFYAEGAEGSLELLAAEIESRLAEIHVEAGERLQQDGPKRAQPEVEGAGESGWHDQSAGDDRDGEEQWGGRGRKRKKHRWRERDDGDGWRSTTANGTADWWSLPHIGWWDQSGADRTSEGTGCAASWGDPPDGGSSAPNRGEMWGHDGRDVATGAAHDLPDGPPSEGNRPGQWSGGQQVCGSPLPDQRQRERSPRGGGVGRAAVAGPGAAEDVEAFFDGLPSEEFAPLEGELADAVGDFLVAWSRDHPDGERATLLHLGADAKVRECRANSLPRGVTLQMWFERRLQNHIELACNEKGQTVVGLAPGVEVGGQDA